MTDPTTRPPTDAETLLIEVDKGVAVVTLNRPRARNALDSTLLAALPAAMAAVEADDQVDVVILTGADPAFCAGLDLRGVGDGGAALVSGAGWGSGEVVTPWPAMTKPVIGAVNGPAVTGGLELALQCDFLVASERASFADTHARVGIVPGWGMSVLLPQAVGLRMAREMSLTGRFVGAEEALRLGLVNRVVPHDELLPTARSIAEAVIANDRRAARALLAEYAQTSATTAAEGLRVEAQIARDWHATSFDPADIARRREQIVERGRGSAETPPPSPAS